MFNSLRKTASTAAVTLSAMAATASTVLAQGTPSNNSTQVTPPPGFFGDFTLLFNRLLQFVLALAALLVFFYLIWGGIEWITSGGDKGKTEKARDKITAAVIGLIVLAASWAILMLILTFLNAGDFNSILNSGGLQ